MATKLATLVRERDTAIRTIIYLERKLADHGNNPITEIKLQQHQEAVARVQEKVDENFHKISTTCDPSDMDAHANEYEMLMDRILDIREELKSVQESIGPKMSCSTIPASTMGASSDIRLPRLSLPTFEGRLEDWSSFRDMFITTIDQNVNLSDAQKLTYLKAQLKGEAARQVQSLSICDANYNIAMQQLIDRYQNDRQLLFAIMRRLFNQQAIVTPNSTSLRQLVDVTRECLRSMETLNQPVQSWSSIILFLIYQKLDAGTKELYEQSLSSSRIPELKELYEFIEQRSRALEAAGVKTQVIKSADRNKFATVQKPGVHHTQHSAIKCQVCDQCHPIYRCQKFNSMDIKARQECVKGLNLCFNCLRPGHRSQRCESSGSCKSCGAKHNSLLHLTAQPKKCENSNEVPKLNHHTNIGSASQTLLATAVIKVKDCSGNYQSVRAFLDGGSETHIITADCLKRLGLKWKRQHASVTGLSSVPVGHSMGIVDLEFTPHFTDHVITADQVRVMNSLTSQLPSNHCDKNQPHFYGLQLADENWHTPAAVDMLIGASLAYGLIRGDKMHGNSSQPFAQSSDLGWLIVGNVDSEHELVTSNYHTTITDTYSYDNNKVIVSNSDLDATLQSFWETEEVTHRKPCLTEDERKCEEHFTESHRRLQDGRYQVRLPMKQPCSELGSSYDKAAQRLKQLERRFTRYPEKREAYIQFMQEYEQAGHMEVVTTKEPMSDVYYIPHHFVCKEDSTTTKLRVVFDASSKTSTGKSLNDCLLIGPTIQRSLLSIMLKFRTYVIAFTADVKQMYRQIRVHRDDCDLQRILWRESPEQPMKQYRLLTVTYGTAAAPFLATRALQQLGRDEAEGFPLASQAVENDFYVDDCMSGAQSEGEASRLKEELMSLMKRGQLELRKWSTNSSELLQTIPVELRETKSILEVELGPTVKTLGIHWQPQNDVFLFKTDCNNDVSHCLTKRSVLSQIAKIFDPIGWLAPVIISAKIMMQKLWKLNLGWDDPLPEAVVSEWNQYRSELPSLEKLVIPRCVVVQSATSLSLIGFGDASELAYAAVVYLNSCSEGESKVSLLASKTRVAPTKSISIPRLELNAAVLLAELMVNVKESLQQEITSMAAYTDSTVTLAWIKSHPSRWQTFVANRVTRIQECIPSKYWNHVPGSENPADCASRGVAPSLLKDHSLWWSGPSWIADGAKIRDPEPSVDQFSEALKEERRVTKCITTKINVFFDSEKYSTLVRLQRTTAWVFRFIFNVFRRVQVRNDQFLRRFTVKGMFGETLRIGLLSGSCCGLSVGRQQPSSVEPLKTTELKFALDYWIKRTQNQYFSRDMEMLRGAQKLPKCSNILRLNPFLDKDGFLRVGGRLSKSQLEYNAKHPVLLPCKAHFSKLLIMHHHDRLFHAGAQLLHSILVENYWITNFRETIRLMIRKCVTCSKMRAELQTQLMGDLPSSRVTPSRAFAKVGVDYAGPFILKPMLQRSKTSIKCYIALFVCFSTRAIHLKVVSNLTTDAFIAALRRFIARRGRPVEIHSDCGTNFIGASRELKELSKLILSNKHNHEISNVLSTETISWRFNPPGAPHFGGLWEAGVKSVKFHLRRVMGLQRFNFEEFSTILAQIEAILNSRPITPVSSDPSDLNVLTPGHFLIGQPMTAAPEREIADERLSRLSRWEQLQSVYQSFWKRWSREYLSRMQLRPKWMSSERQIAVGDLVTIKDENLPPLHWKLGRVQEIHPGQDGLVRVVTLKCSNGIIKRPIRKICLLPIDNNRD